MTIIKAQNHYLLLINAESTMFVVMLLSMSLVFDALKSFDQIANVYLRKLNN